MMMMKHFHHWGSLQRCLIPSNLSLRGCLFLRAATSMQPVSWNPSYSNCSCRPFLQQDGNGCEKRFYSTEKSSSSSSQSKQRRIQGTSDGGEKLFCKMSFGTASNEITKLARSKTPWSSFSQSMKTDIRQCFLNGCYDPNEKNLSHVCAFISAFSQLKYQWSTNDEVKQALFHKFEEIMERTNARVEARGIATFLHLLRKANLNIHTIPSTTIDKIIIGVNKYLKEFNSQELSNIFLGFGSIGLKWDQHMPAELKSELIRVLKERIKEFNKIGIAAFLAGAADMKFRWFDAKQQHQQEHQQMDLLKEEIFQSILKVYQIATGINAMDGRTASSILFSLGKIGIKKEMISEEDFFLSFLKNHLFHWPEIEMNEQVISNILWGLGEMNISWKELSPSTQQTIEDLLEKKLSTFTMIGLLNLVNSCAQMECPWYQQDKIKEKFFTQILSLLMEEEEGGGGKESRKPTIAMGRHLGNIIYRLGKSGLKLDQIPSKVLRGFYYSIDQSMKQLNGVDLSNLFFGYGEIGVQWTEIPLSYRDAMERRLLVHLRSLRGRELSDLLSGSIGMNYLWHKNPAIRDAVYLQIIHLYGQQQQPIDVHENQNNDVRHEGEEEGDIGVKREGIQEEQQEEVTSFAKIVYAMGKIGVRECDLTMEVSRALSQGVKTFRPMINPQQLSLLTSGFQTIRNNSKRK